MSKRVTDSNVWNLSVKEHFDMLDDISMLYDDMDFVKEILESNDIDEVKKALMSIHINGVEKAIINYTNFIMETAEPHSKEMQGKAVDLYDRMLRDYYKQMGLDYDKMLEDDELIFDKEHECEHDHCEDGHCDCEED